MSPESRDAMGDLILLGAIDIDTLGARIVFREYLLGAVFSTALGVFLLFRSHSAWLTALGIYFACVVINYAPMLWLAFRLRLARPRPEMAEPSVRRWAISRFHRNSAVLLIPLLPVAHIVHGAIRQGFYWTDS